MPKAVLHDSIEEPPVFLRKFTIEEYHRIGEAGILHPNDRVELIDGLLVQMAPIGPEHQFIVEKLNDLFSEQNRGRFKVGPGRPIPFPISMNRSQIWYSSKPAQEPGDNTLPRKTSIWSWRFQTPHSNTILEKSSSRMRTP